MKLAAIHGPLGSMGRHLLALCFTIIFALALDTGVALAMGHGGGASGGERPWPQAVAHFG